MENPKTTIADPIVAHLEDSADAVALHLGAQKILGQPERSGPFEISGVTERNAHRLRSYIGLFAETGSDLPGVVKAAADRIETDGRNYPVTQADTEFKYVRYYRDPKTGEDRAVFSWLNEADAIEQQKRAVDSKRMGNLRVVAAASFVAGVLAAFGGIKIYDTASSQYMTKHPEAVTVPNDIPGRQNGTGLFMVGVLQAGAGAVGGFGVTRRRAADNRQRRQGYGLPPGATL